MTDDVLCTVQGPLGLITLNRPKALNALTLGMIRAIDPALKAWAADPAIKAVVIRGAGDRAFCAGGDVRAVYDSGLAMKRGDGDGELTRAFFREEYTLNRRIKLFPKPYIAILDGITMGGGVGLSAHGSHRVTTEKTLLAMPETGIGLFPDVGASYLLSRMPGQLGTYLALTGARLGPADVHYVGIGTAHFPSAAVEAFMAGLAAADWSTDDPDRMVDELAAAHEVAVGEPGLVPCRDAIDRCFAAATVEDILAALTGEGTAWCDSTARDMSGLSPTSMKITLEEIRRGAALTFDDCLRLEYRLTQACMARHDFFEGIRAVLVDKDRNPKWRPTTLDLVADAEVSDHFVQPADGDLAFAD